MLVGPAQPSRRELTAPRTPDLTPEKKEALRTNLEDIIVTILRRHSALQYFQGYHDVRFKASRRDLAPDHLFLLFCRSSLSYNLP